MLRAVLDPGVLIAAVLSPEGAPNRLLRAWIEGRFELVVSPALLNELGRVLQRDKFRKYLSLDEVAEYVDLLSRAARVMVDPPLIVGLTPDPGDDYLVCLARAAEAHVLVSGDPHLYQLKDAEPPVLRPRVFLDFLESGDPLEH